MKFYFLTLLTLLQILAFSQEKPNANQDKKILLQENDIVALCGDSITSAGQYPNMIEIYQIVCQPNPKVTLKNFGRWGETAASFPPAIDKDVLPTKPTVATICYGMNNCRSAKVMGEASAKNWANGEIKTVVKKFKENGVRQIFLASPGCVDSEHFTLSQSAPPLPEAIVATNANLKSLRDQAERLAKEENLIFVDVHNPMIEVMAKAKEKYGKEFAFAGGKGDGVHPGQAGHLVMAWAFLKAMGYDGEIGTIQLDYVTAISQSTEGHIIKESNKNVLKLESIRYPFCVAGDEKNANSTRSVAELFTFHQDLNRLVLIVKNAPEKTKITWGNQWKEFSAKELALGINLAKEFIENPFSAPFAKIYAAIQERNQCTKWLQKEYKDDPNMVKRYEKALENCKPQTIKHEIKIEAVQ